jgi:type II secretion system protein H
MSDARVPATGFTLIEVLVVLALVGITLAVAVVNLAHDDRSTLRAEAARLAVALQHARDEAILTNGTIAWVDEGSGYAFVQRGADGAWSTITDVYRLPAAVRLVSLHAGVPAPLALAVPGAPLRVTLETDDARAQIELALRASVVMLDAR